MQSTVLRSATCEFSCWLCTVTAFSQSDRGAITGAVSDPAGAVVPAAAVTAKSTETGAQFETVTTTFGFYNTATAGNVQTGGIIPTSRNGQLVARFAW